MKTMNDNHKEGAMKTLAPINGISALTKLFPATLFSAPLRGRKTQKIISNLLMSIIAFMGATASLAIAGEHAEENGSSLLVILFLGLGALIVIFQLIPSLMLFCSMMKGLFGKGGERRERIIALTPELGLTMADGGSQVKTAVKKTIPVADKTEEMSD